MYNIIISISVHNTIDSFIIGYRRIFLDLFDDTGIENEYLIKEIYIKSSKELKNKIYQNIKFIFSGEKILGKRKLENNNFLITIPINNFRLFITYKEKNKLKERYIINIEFFKK